MLRNMAESSRGEQSTIPEYEVQDMNSKTVHLGSLALFWRDVLTSRDISLQQEDEEVEMGEEEPIVAEELGCNTDTAAELRHVCSGKRTLSGAEGNVVLVDTLKYEGEDDAQKEVIPVDTDLVTLGIRRKMQERREETIIIDRICRQEKFTYAMATHSVGKRPEKSPDFVEEGELLLALNIIYPVIFEKHKEQKPYQTVLVLGSQKLTELRDSITCVSDLQVGGEFSNTPDLVPEHISKDLYKSAFFYFNGMFYNDMRYPECRDLSRTTIAWSESLHRGYGKFQTANMDNCTFNDLNIKIGFPYLYCHQGDCEHIILITDVSLSNDKETGAFLSSVYYLAHWVNPHCFQPKGRKFKCRLCLRLIHKDDCLDRKLYPLVIKKPWLLTRKCFVCNTYIARWVTNEDSFAPEDPCLFCDVCFRMLHYDAEGKKLGEFLAYPYLDPGTFN